MATLLEVKTSLPYFSSFPWDKTENTFWFRLPEVVIEDNILNCIDAVTRFFNDNEPTYGHCIADYYPFGVVDLENATCTTRAVDEASGDLLSIPVEFPFPIAAGDPVGEFSMPAEMALCLSFFQDHSIEPSVPKARKRGRVYIGPLAGDTETYTIEPYMRPTERLALTLLNGAAALHDELNGLDTTTGCDWVVYSRRVLQAYVDELIHDQGTTTVTARAGFAHTITDLWVDNEWDTQRRRGMDATSRWTATL